MGGDNPLATRLPEERRRIGLTAAEVGGLLDGWSRGHWYDLEPSGLRVLVLRVPADGSG